MNYEFKGTAGSVNMKECPVCKLKFKPKLSVHKTCSRKCGYILRGNKPQQKRMKNEVWWVNAKGYIEGRIRSEDGSVRRVKQHRYFVELAIGRRLSKDEDVHHINGIKTDNSIENLQVVSHSSHTRITNSNRIYKKGYKLNLSECDRKNRAERMKINRLHNPLFSKSNLPTP